MKHSLRFLVLGTALLASNAMAGARDDLKSFTTGLKGLEGQFTQQVYDTKGQLKESTSGRIALSAPQLFRWEYTKPYPQLILANGSKVWVYDPDLKQVAIRTLSAEEKDTPLHALLNPGKLDQQFNVKETGKADGLEWLVLTPRVEGGASFQSARLGFGKQGLARMEVKDAMGLRNVISFSGWKRNPTFASNMFTYVPSADVDEVGDL